MKSFGVDAEWIPGEAPPSAENDRNATQASLPNLDWKAEFRFAESRFNQPLYQSVPFYFHTDFLTGTMVD